MKQLERNQNSNLNELHIDILSVIFSFLKPKDAIIAKNTSLKMNAAYFVVFLPNFMFVSAFTRLASLKDEIDNYFLNPAKRGHWFLLRNPFFNRSDRSKEKTICDIMALSEARKLLSTQQIIFMKKFASDFEAAIKRPSRAQIAGFVFCELIASLSFPMRCTILVCILTSLKRIWSDLTYAAISTSTFNEIDMGSQKYVPDWCIFAFLLTTATISTLLGCQVIGTKKDRIINAVTLFREQVRFLPVELSTESTVIPCSEKQDQSSPTPPLQHAQMGR